MAKPGPKEEKGSSILKRVESFTTLGFLAPTPAPHPAAASTSVPSRTEDKAKEEKKSKKEIKVKEKKGKKEREKEIKKEETEKKDSRWKRMSQILNPFAAKIEATDTSQIPKPGSEQRDEKKETEIVNKGSVRYRTHDGKPLHAEDLRRLSVRVCTHAERREQMAAERGESDAKKKKPTTTLQDLFATSTSDLSSAAAPVRKGSVIENIQQLTSALEETKISDQQQPPSSNPPLLHRTSSIVFNDAEAQIPSSPKKSKHKNSVPKPP